MAHWGKPHLGAPAGRPDGHGIQEQRGWVNLVRKLIQDNREAQKAYRDAVEQTADQELRAFLCEQSLERAEFVVALQSHLQPLGKAVPPARNWLDARDVYGGDASILAALENGEASVRANYEESLLEGMPEELNQLLRQQCETVKCVHDHLRLLRERLAQSKEAA